MTFTDVFTIGRDSSENDSVAGGKGFEPLTLSLEGKDFDLKSYRQYLNGKYSKQYATLLYGYTVKYSSALDNPQKLSEVPTSIRGNVLKAVVALSKYIGSYEEYKTKLKSHGIKWVNGDTAFNGFLSIFSKQHDTLGQWVQQIQPILAPNERLYVKFLAITGLRRTEAINSFNLIIDLNSKGKLSDYYNTELSCLEHFKYGKLFLRGTKNAYISFASKAMIEEISQSQPVSYYALHSRLDRKHIKLRLKELRSYNNSYLRKNGIISELVDILAGRVPKSVFARHYLGEGMKTFSNQVLSIQEQLDNSLHHLTIPI